MAVEEQHTTSYSLAVGKVEMEEVARGAVGQQRRYPTVRHFRIAAEAQVREADRQEGRQLGEVLSR